MRYYVTPIVFAEAFARSLDFHLDLDQDRVCEIDSAEDLVGAGGVNWLFHANFAAAVDDLEVRSTSAARIERKEIGSFGNSFIKDDFSKGDVGF